MVKKKKKGTKEEFATRKKRREIGTTRVHRVRFTPLTLCRLKTNSPAERKKKGTICKCNMNVNEFDATTKTRTITIG